MRDHLKDFNAISHDTINAREFQLGWRLHPSFAPPLRNYTSTQQPWQSIRDPVADFNPDTKTSSDLRPLRSSPFPVVNCSGPIGIPAITNRYLPYFETPSRPQTRQSSPERLPSSEHSVDVFLEQPLSRRQRAFYKPSRYCHNSESGFNRRIRRRTVSVQSLDSLLVSLDLNELSLSAVRVAMGKDGSAQTISPQKEAKYRKIFHELDVDDDGRVDVSELRQAFKNMGLWQIPGQAEKFVTASDSNKDGQLDVAEFVRYLHEHEMKLQLMFKKIDRDKDGKISAYEMQQALKSVGLPITNKEANDIMKRMDKDGSSLVDLDEWVEHHLLHPSTDIKDIVFYWRHAQFMDIGESLLVPDDFTEDEKLSGRWWRLLVSGGAAGAVSRTCTAPLDRIKVLLQVHATKTNNLGLQSGLKALLNEGGIRGLWRGNGINVIKIAPESAIKFFAFERFKHIIGTGDPREMAMHQRFMAGSLAGAFSQTCIYPMEVIKTRLALRKTGQYRGIGDCAMKVYTHEGPSAFFKGYIPNIIGILPYAGIDLCIYETLKNYWIKHHSPDSDVPSVPLLLACGTTSSTCGQLASYPLALIRTKMQAKASSGSKEKLTMMSLARSIYQTDGFTGFYRGIGPNFLKVAPAVSISYVVYEKMKLQLGVS